MGTHDGLKTRGRAIRWSNGAVGAALLLTLAVAPAAAAALCRPGVQYWDEARAQCRDCSVCNDPGHVVLRPCHVHQDTQCGHWRDLNIDWSWLRPRDRARNSTAEATAAPRRPHHHDEERNHRRPHPHRKKLTWKEVAEDEPASGERSDLDATALREANWHRFHKHHKHKSNGTSSGGPHKHHGKHHRGNHHHPHHSTTTSPRHHHPHTFRPPESAAQLRAADFAVAEASAASAPTAVPAGGSGVAGTLGATGAAALQAFEMRTLPPPEPFSSAEALVWDWQVVVLTLAVVGCVLFFVAAAAYGIRQIRRDVRRTVDADSLTATLSLMVPEITNDLTEHCTLDGCNTNQCLCMEQLLVRKQDEPTEGKGNVYIDRGSSKSRV